jgi:hypothetical protein
MPTVDLSGVVLSQSVGVAPLYVHVDCSAATTDHAPGLILYNDKVTFNDGSANTDATAQVRDVTGRALFMSNKTVNDPSGSGVDLLLSDYATLKDLIQQASPTGIEAYFSAGGGNRGFRAITTRPTVAATALSLTSAAVSCFGVEKAMVLELDGVFNAFHDVIFRIDFGDPAGRRWGNRQDVNNNVHLGPISGHVYETPGSYTITISAFTHRGLVATKTIAVAVSAFAGTTYYFAQAGSDGAAGTSEGAAKKTWTHAMTLVAANIRLLFKRGDTWPNTDVTARKTITVADTTTTAFIIGAYGTGARPIFNCANNIGPYDLGAADGGRVTDGRYVGTNGSGAPGTGNCITSIGQKGLLLRLDLNGFLNGLSQGSSTPPKADFGIVDSRMREMRDYDIYTQGTTSGAPESHVGILANVLMAVRDEHHIRFHGAKSVMGYNYFGGRINDGKHYLRVLGNFSGAGNESEFNQVCDNVFAHPNHAFNQSLIQIGAQNSTSIRNLRDLIVERNVIRNRDDYLRETFDEPGSWVYGTGWAHDEVNDEVDFTAPAANLELRLSVTGGLTYKVRYTLRNMTAATVTIQLGGTSGTVRSTNGTFTDTIVCGGSSSQDLEVAATGAGTIDDIIVSGAAIVGLKTAFQLDPGAATSTMSRLTFRNNVIDGCKTGIDTTATAGMVMSDFWLWNNLYTRVLDGNARFFQGDLAFTGLVLANNVINLPGADSDAVKQRFFTVATAHLRTDIFELGNQVYMPNATSAQVITAQGTTYTLAAWQALAFPDAAKGDGDVTAAPTFKRGYWNGTAGLKILDATLPTSPASEPSGMEWDAYYGRLWGVGDEARIWHCLPDGSDLIKFPGGNTRYSPAHDFEGITIAVPGSNFVYTLQEREVADVDDTITIKEINRTTGAIVRTFVLTGVSGFPSPSDPNLGPEGLCFVPDVDDAEGGLFHLIVQQTQRVHVFRLSIKSSPSAVDVTHVESYLPADGAWTEGSGLSYDPTDDTIYVITDAEALMRILDRHGGFIEQLALTAEAGFGAQEGVAVTDKYLFIANDTPPAVFRYDWGGIRYRSLSASSPQVNVGLRVPSAIADMDGNHRAQSTAWDMGPYELGAPPLPDVWGPWLAGMGGIVQAARGLSVLAVPGRFPPFDLTAPPGGPASTPVVVSRGHGVFIPPGIRIGGKH